MPNKCRHCWALLGDAEYYWARFLKILLTCPLSFPIFSIFWFCRAYLLFHYFLCYHLNFQSFHIIILWRRSPSAVVDFRLTSHFKLLKLKPIILDLNTLLSLLFALAMESFSLLILHLPISKCRILQLHWFGHLHIQQCPTMPNKGPAMFGLVGRNVALV